ncbi:plastocyanin/azurin family copper-binding protein [Polynucleobacter sp. IMCC 30228]|uniref:cupredoxin domain-containing protein n=1 Tax=Polynucleobacter sp. IMCC 30228 TaxID=2781011 RepID=UPI001F26EBDE|nr:plastocyanin/azurin family copper-binding protein [Polynucleobacter sp. IMCC 30228]MCE7528263.1 plastocyanin/azurin family copper-binding protein [Polynucleobacter sp. IMCC 30228]
MNFPLSHISSLCKYTGISFTAGAITHGFFSGERAIWTAAFGIIIFLVGGILEKIANPDKDHSWTDVLAIGIVASIGLGFFTGGLQHFPDSPARSAWVVPVGFAMSLLAMYLMEGKGKIKIKGVLIYGGISLALVIAASLYALSYFNQHGGDGHIHDHAAQTQVIVPSVKEIRIDVDDTMRFSPATWEAQAGEPIRIILVNKGKVDHELVIGTEKEIIAHAKEMASPSAKGHHHTNEISAKPGQQAELVWTFKKPGQYAMACFEPGHYEAGMKGFINVVAH